MFHTTIALENVVPREGSNIWYDGWVIPKYAGNSTTAAIAPDSREYPANLNPFKKNSLIFLCG